MFTELSKEQIAGAAQYGQQSVGECLQKTTAKPWVECSIEEKIERTREQLKHYNAKLDHFIQELNRLSDVREELIQHRHAMEDGGKVMLPADRAKRGWGYGQGVGTQTSVDPSKIYF